MVKQTKPRKRKTDNLSALIEAGLTFRQYAAIRMDEELRRQAKPLKAGKRKKGKA